MASSMVDILKRPQRDDYMPRSKPVIEAYGGGGPGNMLPYLGGQMMDRAGRAVAEAAGDEAFAEDTQAWTQRADEALTAEQANELAKQENDTITELLKAGVDVGTDNAAKIGIPPTEYQKWVDYKSAKQRAEIAKANGKGKGGGGPKFSIDAEGNVKATGVGPDNMEAVSTMIKNRKQKVMQPLFAQPTPVK